MKDLDIILEEYQFFVYYENVLESAGPWMRYPRKYNDFLLCKSIDDVMICILQAFLSCIYFEKSMENDFDSSNTFEEMIAKYGLLPDISEEMKVELLSFLSEYKQNLINMSENCWNDKNYTENEKKHSLVGRNSCVSSTFRLIIRNGAKIKYDIGMSGLYKRYMDYTQAEGHNDFQPIGMFGYHLSNYIYFYSIEKINSNILYFRKRVYNEKINHTNINDFIELKFLGKLKLCEKSKEWISESYKIIENSSSIAISLDRTNGFLIDEIDFENRDTSSFVYTKIYVLNRRKYYCSNTSITSFNLQKAIEHIQTTNNVYRNYFLFKKTSFYENLIPELRREIKSYCFF
jgi:hypothetical protein